MHVSVKWLQKHVMTFILQVNNYAVTDVAQ